MNMIWILMQNNLKAFKQYAKVVGTASRVLGMIYRTFAYIYDSCLSSPSALT